MCHGTDEIELQKQHEISDSTEKIKIAKETCPVRFRNLQINW